MGFFFTQQRKTQTAKDERPAKSNKQNVETLRRLGCKACPLDKLSSPKMEPTLAEDTKIYFLGEAPEENERKPLTGNAGKILRECILEEDIEFCSFDNTINCPTKDGKTPTWQEVACCHHRRIKYIEQAKPKLIVGLGLVPLSAMLGSTDLAGMRGRVFAIQVGKHQCWFMPTYHPAFIAKTAFKKDRPLQSKLGHCFRMDVQKAFKLLSTLPKAKVDTEAEARANIQTFNGAGFDTLLRLLKAATAAPIKAIDLETSTLRPYATNALMLTAAVSYDDINFSFAVDHPKSRWSSEQRKKILSSLKELITDTTTLKVAHNAPFEIEWLVHYFGKEIVQHDAWECTMMQAHVIDERRGRQAAGDDRRRATYQSLDFLCQQHFGIAYKKFFKLPKHDMINADLGETLTYNAVDTKYTLRLYYRQYEILESMKLLPTYYETIPRQPTVALMQFFGIAVDQKERERAQKKLEVEIKDIEDKIRGLKVVKAYIADHGEFNPLGQDTLAIFKDYLKRPEVEVVDKSGNTRLSTDKNVLDQIDHPLAELVIELRNRTKLKSTYVDCFEAGKGAAIWPDGRIHTNFNTTFTETARLSSDEPNQQNWPKRKDAWVRKQVVPDKGHLLVAFDYGQLEGCTAAICSQDKVLVQALWDDYDIHMEWTHRLAEHYPQFLAGSDTLKDKKTAKKYRSIVKNKLVFPAIFGATTKSISGYLKSPEDKIEDLMDDFWHQFHGLKDWQDKLMKGYYNDGYVSSPTGRRHNYPLTRNEAINFPVQSVAADIVCRSMNTLSEYAVKTGKWYYHPILNIHDDLTFIIPDDTEKLETSIEYIYKIMLTPKYKFINVPLSVECSLGPNWFQMEDIGKFWSHKDV